jgi:hypothetical protein
MGAKSEESSFSFDLSPPSSFGINRFAPLPKRFFLPALPILLSHEKRAARFVELYEKY